jgi:hypothetical protein
LSVDFTSDIGTVTKETLIFEKIELIGGGVTNDDIYGLPPYDGALTRYLDNDQVITAGDVGMAVFEIRTTENKLSS